MEEEAVKKLTQQGCMVEKNAAEELTEEDVDLIRSLDATPMFVSKKMVDKLREKRSAANVSTGNGGVKTVQKQKIDVESGDSELAEEFQNTGSKFSKDKTVTIRDTGSRDKLETKVEVMDESDITTDEKDVPEFLDYYNDRYDKMKKLITRRQEMKAATTINRLERKDEGDEATTIGFVKDKYSTSSGKYIVELEDKTGNFKALVNEREGQRIVPDEVIGVRGSMGGDIIYADSIVRPDLPIPHQSDTNSTQDKIEAAYISDFHMGSEDTLHKRLDRFANWLKSDEHKIGYIFIPGDLVEGVGVYPGQEKELEVTDIYKQYQLFEEWFQKIPEDIQVIVSPGNHDITRLAEPQPRLPENIFPEIADYKNLHRVQNPQMVRIHGIRSKGVRNLMYHGYSFDDHVDRIKELREKAYDEPHHVMIDLVKRRHLAPTYGSNMLSPEGQDNMVITQKPDVFVAGHFHSHANTTYKGTNIIASSTFQGQTEFQKRMGHEPDPGKVTILNLKTRKTEVKQF